MTIFASDSIWNQPLADDAELDAASDAMNAQLAADTREFSVGFGGAVGMPIYEVDESVPLVEVSIPNPSTTQNRDLARYLAGGVRIPTSAIPQNDPDHALVIVEPAADACVELWQAVKAADGSWSAK